MARSPRHPAAVRPAVPGDAAALGRLHVRSWQVAYRDIIPPAVLDLLRPGARGHRWWRTIQRSRAGGVRNWVCERDGALTGLLTTGPARDPDVAGMAELWAIYLAPEEWGGDLAPRLMSVALHDLRARGATGAVLWVLRDNRRARRFYERFGWRPDGARQRLSIGGYPIWEVRYRRDFARTGPLPVVRRR